MPHFQLDIIWQKAIIITVANNQIDEILAFLLHNYSQFNASDFVAILPSIVAGLGTASIATAALLVILMEIHRRGHISADGTVHVDGQPINNEVANTLNEVNETVSTATDLVDRTVELVQGQDGEIVGRELDRVRNILGNANNTRRNLNEILDRLPEEGIVIRNIDLDEIRTIAIDFLEAFEQLMNIL